MSRAVAGNGSATAAWRVLYEAHASKPDAQKSVPHE
jgi:hypothetical protein